jgi:hypothetical protein
MERQPVPLEAFRQHFEDTASVMLRRESHHEVVRETDQESAALQARLDHLLEPYVHHIVKVDIR